MQKIKTIKKIVMTGGHAGATAYAFIEQIKSDKNTSKLYWIGSGKAIEGKNVSTYEAEVLPELGVEFHSLVFGKLQTKFSLWTIPSLLKFPLGFLHAFYLLMKIQPNVILSFGGFSSFPVVFDAWLLKIPIIIHEQTIVYGRANKLASFFANIIALSRQESEIYFPKEKCIVVGNPISQEIQQINPKSKITKPPVLFITGGSRGAIAINDIVQSNLEELLNSYHVIHQTGSLQEEKLKDRREHLPANLRNKYEVYGLIKPREWKVIMEKADIILSRSGANIISEILVTKRPSLLIPLPIAYMDEQKKNAQYAKQFGIAEILDQKDLTESTFLAALEKIKTHWSSYVSKVKDKKSVDIDAAKKLADLVFNYSS